MIDDPQVPLIRRRYREVFGASLRPCFAAWMHHGGNGANGAGLGYHRADSEPLFLEAYLDEPIEQAVSAALGRTIEREKIVEIGNFAADNALSMMSLWGAAANDLGGASEVAVATLTAPLRAMFARVRLPITVIAPARPERFGEVTDDWGSYYDLDPQVCAGVISDGQRAISRFLSRRREKIAA